MMDKQEFLDTLSWQDMVIVNYQQAGLMLLLVCKSEERAKTLYDFLLANRPYIRISMNLRTKEYSIHFFFKHPTLKHIAYDTGKSHDSYPPLRQLGNGEVKFLSTGTYTATGSMIIHNPIVFNRGSSLN